MMQKLKLYMVSPGFTEKRKDYVFQVLNFARVPLRHQLVVMNGGTILDSAFLCWYALDSIGSVRAVMVSELCALCAYVRLMHIHV